MLVVASDGVDEDSNVHCSALLINSEIQYKVSDE